MPENNSELHPGRDYKRYKVDAFATVIFNKNIKKALMINDVSARGLGGLIAYSPKVNEEVEIILQTPFFENPVKKEAKVIWCKKKEENLWEIGLDFGLDNKLVLDDHLKKFLG